MTKLYYFLAAEQFQPEVLVEHAVLAEQAGFDGVMISEHFHPWVDDDSAAGFTFSTLGAIARATDRVALMTAVTTPLWRFSPAVVAQTAATIDRLSNGRFALGVGMGRAHDEAPAGFEYPPYAERNARMREALDIMEQLLAGNKLSHQGTHYQTQTAKLYSPPVHKVPIYMAAGGPKSTQLAGEKSDGIIVSVKSIEAAKKTIALAKQHSPTDEFAAIAMSWTVLAGNDDEAWQALAGLRGLRAPDRDHRHDPEELRKQADELPREEILSKFRVVDSAEGLIDAYRPIIDELKPDILGLQIAAHKQESTFDDLKNVVLPALRKETT